MGTSGPTKRGRLLGILFLVGLSAVIAVLLYGVIIDNAECVQAKNDYEENSVLAREKYGYSTFEEWKENEVNLGKDCGLKHVSF